MQSRTERIVRYVGVIIIVLCQPFNVIADEPERTVYWEAVRIRKGFGEGIYRDTYYVKGYKIRQEYIQLSPHPPHKTIWETIKIWDETGQYLLDPIISLLVGHKKLKGFVLNQSASTTLELAKAGAARWKLPPQLCLHAFFGDPTTSLILLKAEGAKKVGMAKLKGHLCEIYKLTQKDYEEIAYVRNGQVMKKVSKGRMGFSLLDPKSKRTIGSFEGGEYEVTTNYTVVKVGLDIPDSVFAIPPKGYQLITENELLRIEQREQEHLLKQMRAEQAAKAQETQRQREAEKKMRVFLTVGLYLCLAALIMLFIALRRKMIRYL